MEAHQLQLFTSLCEQRSPRLVEVVEQPEVGDNDNEGPWPHLPFPDGWHASS